MAIKDKTIDEALIEVMRTKRALEALRNRRRVNVQAYPDDTGEMTEHAAALRASMDLTRKLADLRQGR